MTKQKLQPCPRVQVGSQISKLMTELNLDGGAFEVEFHTHVIYIGGDRHYGPQFGQVMKYTVLVDDIPLYTYDSRSNKLMVIGASPSFGADETLALKIRALVERAYTGYYEMYIHKAYKSIHTYYVDLDDGNGKGATLIYTDSEVK